jgi:hypothetical protein
MTSFKRAAGVSGSEPRPTTPNIPVMGMIWQDEIIKDRKRREWAAFYAGCAVGAAILSLSFLFTIKLIGGWCP